MVLKRGSVFYDFGGAIDHLFQRETEPMRDLHNEGVKVFTDTDNIEGFQDLDGPVEGSIPKDGDVLPEVKVPGPLRL